MPNVAAIWKFNMLEKLSELLGTPVVASRRIGGGDISEVYEVEAPPQRYCVKFLASAPVGFFQNEAQGLRVIENLGVVRTPQVMSVSDHHLALRWIECVTPTKQAWRDLGEQLATMHRLHRQSFGFEADGFCGLTPQSNTPMRDGFAFFAQQRIEPQLKRARDTGLLRAAEASRIQHIADRLDRWIPKQSPSLIHGDLWSGNVLFSPDGPVLIDPAAHNGWAEADLAMTKLFGGFTADFYRAYHAFNPLPSGFGERVDLYNLYHLLNHLNLFGSIYHGRIMQIVTRFS